MELYCFITGHKYSNALSSKKRKKYESNSELNGGKVKAPNSPISSDDEDNGKYMSALTEDNQWFVEKIIAKRTVVEEDGERAIYYLLKWKGWDHKDASWEMFASTFLTIS